MQKFEKEDKAYLQQRKQYAEQTGFADLYGYIDHFSLYAGVQTLGNKLFVYELLKQSLEVPGHVIEFGCWKGANLLFMAKVLKLMQPNSYKKVIGFDNFSGLPAGSAEDGAFAKEMEGRYEGDYENLQRLIEVFDFEGYVELVAGDALDTIPQYQQANPEVLVSLAYIDFDLYEPVKKALDYLEETLAVGGMIVFDEGIHPKWPGETVAMKEFLASSKHKFEMGSNGLSRQPTMFLTRVA